MSAPIANVYEYLSADQYVTAIVGNRIYSGKAEQTAQPPFVVWSLVSNVPQLQLAGRPTVDAQLMQVDAYSRDPAQARDLAFTCRDALESRDAVIGQGPRDFGVEDATGLARWSLEAAYIWRRVS